MLFLRQTRILLNKRKSFVAKFLIRFLVNLMVINNANEVRTMQKSKRNGEWYRAKEN